MRVSFAALPGGAQRAKVLGRLERYRTPRVVHLVSDLGFSVQRDELLSELRSAAVAVDVVDVRVVVRP